MSLLIAIKSCQRDKDAGFHEAIRETWGKDLQPLLFFLGGFAKSSIGEVALPCPDDYLSLPLKTHEICRWIAALPIVPEHTFFCDNDTILNVKNFIALPYSRYDYAGHFRGGQPEINHQFRYEDHTGVYPDCYPWASGGIGYFLSAKAIELIATTEPQVWAEDMYVGQVLGPYIASHEIKAAALSMHSVATWHFRKSKLHPQFTPDLLRRIYRDGSPGKVYAEARNAR